MTRITKKSIEPLIEAMNAGGVFIDDRSRRFFTDLAQTSLNGTRPHLADPSYTVAPWTFMRQIKPDLKKVNEPLDSPFLFLPHDPAKRTATGFKFRPDIVVNLGDLEGETPVSVETGRKIRREKHAVAFKDARGARSTFKLPIYQDIPVDRAALHRMALEGDKIEAENARTILRQSPDGMFRQQYQESRHGRLYGKGINLQNVKSSVRRAAMPPGAVEYDIENCHGRLLNHLATSLGYKSGILQVYADYCIDIREQIAEDLKVPYALAKQLVLMSIYWSGIRSGIRREVIKAGGDPEVLREGLFKELWKDIRAAGRHVIRHGERGRNGHCNALGKSIPTTESPGTVLSHYLTGLERQVLDIAIDSAEGVLLLEHDGFSALGGDTEMFAEQVLKQAGIPVKFTVKSEKR